MGIDLSTRRNIYRSDACRGSYKKVLIAVNLTSWDYRHHSFWTLSLSFFAGVLVISLGGRVSDLFMPGFWVGYSALEKRVNEAQMGISFSDVWMNYGLLMERRYDGLCTCIHIKNV